MLTAPTLTIDLPAGYTARPATLADVPAMHAVLVAADAADGRTSAGALADKQRNFDDTWSLPETDSLLVFAPGGDLAGWARLYANPEPEAEIRAYLTYEVRPQHRPLDLENSLLAWLEARGRERLHELAANRPGMPALMRASTQDTMAARLALFGRRGFTPLRYFYRMRRDLHQPLPEAPVPEGVELCAYRPDLDRGAWETFNASFRDHWGFEWVTYADWQQFFVGQSTFRPDLTRLAVATATGEVAGISINRVSPEENARHGSQEAWIGQLGVRREWRKRGLASALLIESMRAFRADGLDFAVLGVDTANTTGALGLYERVGFVPVARYVSVAKTVAVTESMNDHRSA